MTGFFSFEIAGKCVGLSLLAIACCVLPCRGQEASPRVGTIEGEDVAVKGQVSLQRESGRSVTVLFSGSEVTVRNGMARITLADGSEIDVCGPAQFTLLKSDENLTLAMHHGRVHMRVGPSGSIRVFTAQIVADALSVGGAYRDAVIGLEESGTVCALTYRGAVRFEQQLTGQSIVIPESSEVQAPGGLIEGLREARGACRCDPAPSAASTPPTASAAANTQPSSAGNSPPKPKGELKPEPPREEPVWKVLMPPLSYNAGQPPPPDPSPEIFVLIREARVIPTTTFTGRVEPRGKKTKTPKPPKLKKGKKPSVTEAAAGQATASQPAENSANANSATAAKDSSAAPTARKSTVEQAARTGFGAKVKGFFRRLFGGKAKS